MPAGPDALYEPVIFHMLASLSVLYISKFIQVDYKLKSIPF